MSTQQILIITALATGSFCASFLGERADAQDYVAPAREVGEYRGVTPGRENPPPQEARARAASSTVATWPGFEARGGGRFFIQVTGNTTPSISASEGRVEVLLPNTTTHLRNTRRWLRTQFFNTPVLRARLEVRGENLAFVMVLRDQVTPQLSSAAGDNGYRFVYVDFPAGNYR